MAYKPNSKMRPMSIDAMLDMERQEVLALLESKNQQVSHGAPAHIRSASPYAPRSPVRSMLDIAEENTEPASKSGTTQAPVRSMLDVASSSSPSTPAAPVRSMLDFGPTPTGRIPQGRSSTPSSPRLPTSSLGPHPRSRSDAEFGPRLSHTTSADPTSGYQFSGILPHSSGPQRLKWFSQSGKKKSESSMREALKNADLSGLQLPNDRGRNSLIGNRFSSAHHQSKSPHGRRWESRSRSPATFSTGHFQLDDGQVVDMNNAYRRLSDANLAFSSGSLAQLPIRKKSEEVGEGRLIKDYLGPDGEHLDSSEDDEPFSSDDEDRGRKKAPRTLNNDISAQTTGRSLRSASDKGERKTLSLLAAAEEERSHVASLQPKFEYKSLIPEPEIQITNSSGETLKNASRRGVHPATSYDQGPASNAASVMDSDEEADVDDIKRAQKLAFSMTNILDTAEAHRAIRIIYRGEYNKIAQTAEEESHRLRKYLVATDLSDESTHALEWAIGTVLRDGDTMIAICCIDEETGITGENSVVPDESKAMKEQAAVINSMTNTKAAPAQVSPVTEFKRTHFRGGSTASSTPAVSPGPVAHNDVNKAEQERHRAVQFITDKVLRLLRKTKLQVRVIVEVLHCKNPRHLVTEVIDLVNPTLVVIGSRGRSALKGVILGSFSNYLVTKSSVPVMVARKRLRKQSKYKRTPVRQVNNLANPAVKSLANAIIDL